MNQLKPALKPAILALNLKPVTHLPTERSDLNQLAINLADDVLLLLAASYPLTRKA